MLASIVTLMAPVFELCLQSSELSSNSQNHWFPLKACVWGPGIAARELKVSETLQ